MINKTLEDFVNDSNLFDATLMRIHFIGETVKSIPFSLKKNYKIIRWRKFARLRNIIGHKYNLRPRVKRNRENSVYEYYDDDDDDDKSDKRKSVKRSRRSRRSRKSRKSRKSKISKKSVKK